MNPQSWTQHLPFEKATIAKRTIPKIQAFLGTSVQNVSYHVINILKDKGLDENSVIKNYLITASDGKKEWHRDRTTTGTGTGTNDPL